MVQAPITYKQLVDQSEQLKGDLTRLANDSVTTAKERAIWLAQTWALFSFTAFYWVAVVPTTWAYVFAVDAVLQAIAYLAPKSELLRFPFEIVLSALSAVQRTLCWIFAYIRHREKCVQCTVKYLKENELEVYGYVVPQKANEYALKYFPIVNDFIAPAADYLLDLILSVRPDNCGQLDHKNDRHECWVLDEGKIRVLPTRSNCPVAKSSDLHRHIQHARVDLTKLASNVAVAPAA